MLCIICGVFFSKFAITMEYLDERVFFLHMFCMWWNKSCRCFFCRFGVNKIVVLWLYSQEQSCFRATQITVLHNGKWEKCEKERETEANREKEIKCRISTRNRRNSVTTDSCTLYKAERAQMDGNAFLIQFDYLQKILYLHNDYEMSRFISSLKRTPSTVGTHRE